MNIVQKQQRPQLTLVVCQQNLAGTAMVQSLCRDVMETGDGPEVRSGKQHPEDIHAVGIEVAPLRGDTVAPDHNLSVIGDIGETQYGKNRAAADMDVDDSVFRAIPLNQGIDPSVDFTLIADVARRPADTALPDISRAGKLIASLLPGDVQGLLFIWEE